MDYAQIYPCIALATRGKIGKGSKWSDYTPHGWWIHKEYKTYKVVAKYYYPTNPQTGLQQGQRALLANAVSYWQNFEDGEKQHYNSMKLPKYMSGYNRYIRMYLNATEAPVIQYLLQEEGETDRILQETENCILLE